MKHIGFVIAAILLSAAASEGWSQGAPYPARLIRVVNPVAPGGNQDIVARAYADQLARGFGQPVVVESRPGSTAMVGTRYVKSAPPDGYTLLAISNTFTRVPAMTADPGYDPVKDFAAISQTCDVPLVLVVNPALPVKTVQEFIALAKRKPGELTVASSGAGSTGHVAAAMFSRQAGIRMLDVQYKGAAPAVIDLVGGHVMLRFDQVTTSLPFIRNGKLRALGVTSARRVAVLAQTPTVAESGFPGYRASLWVGAYVPAKTGRPLVARLNRDINAVLASADVRQALAEQAFETGTGTPAEFSKLMREDTGRWRKVIQDAGLKPDA